MPPKSRKNRKRRHGAGGQQAHPGRGACSFARGPCVWCCHNSQKQCVTILHLTALWTRSCAVATPASCRRVLTACVQANTRFPRTRPCRPPSAPYRSTAPVLHENLEVRLSLRASPFHQLGCSPVMWQRPPCSLRTNTQMIS